MYIDRVLFPVTALGPGERVAIWVAGCSRKCAGCANPELWKRHPEQQMAPERLAVYINEITKGRAEGITITGGEPFEQAQELSVFLEHLEQRGDVLVFTGYRREELTESGAHGRLIHQIDVLVDGPYVEALNDGKAGLRGSTNQNIYFLNEKVRDRYEKYLSEGRKIQNFVYDYKTLSVGIHNPPGVTPGVDGEE